jgi:hypothetical protein
MTDRPLLRAELERALREYLLTYGTNRMLEVIDALALMTDSFLICQSYKTTA